jgi:hypothetical protein
LQELLVTAELGSLADLVRRPGEAWLMLCGGPLIAPAQLPGRAWIAALEQADRLRGPWLGRLCSPPLLEGALDGLVLHHVRAGGVGLHSLLCEWLPCLRPGGRLVLIDAVSSEAPAGRRRLLGQIRRWERERVLHRQGWTAFELGPDGVVSINLDQLSPLRRHWLAHRAGSLRIDYSFSEQAGPLTPLRLLRPRRVALPMHVSGI